MLLACGLQAQTSPDLSQNFDKTDVMIPMRDGIRLHTEIYAPKSSGERFPFLITRTPYGPGLDPQGFRVALGGIYAELAQEGYIFVFQDIRGRYKSEGKFVMMRQPRAKSDSKAIDESTDAYDTVEWLLKNVPNHNGRAGQLGISYGGWLTVMAMIDPHPALKAVSEQASPADMYLGDDFHHNGAFRLSYGLEYSARMETSKQNEAFDFDRFDTFDWFLRLGPIANFNKKYAHEKLPTWNDFVEHPNYDEFWQRQAVTSYLTQATVPNLNVAGWWGSGRFLWAVEDLRDAREIGPGASELSGGGALESRRLGAGHGPVSGKDRLRKRHQQVFSREGSSALVRLLVKGQGRPRPAGGTDVSIRVQQMGTLRRVAAARGRGTEENLFPRCGWGIV